MQILGTNELLYTNIQITNIHRSENRFSSKSHRHNPWAHYPKRNPGEKSWVIPHTAGCQHRIPKRGIRHCWRHFRQRNLCMGSTPHAVTTLRKDLLTELPQSDKRSVRTHVPTKDVSAGMNRSHTSEELICMYCKISWPSHSRVAMRRLAFSKRTEMHLAGPNNFLCYVWSVSEGVLVKT